MKKILTSLLLVINLLLAANVAHAAGVFNLASGAHTNLSSGATMNVLAPSGTIQGYSTHPPASGASQTAYYEGLLAVGADEQRTDAWWNVVQATSSNSYEWGDIDSRVYGASALGIKTLLLIDDTPDWAATSTCTAQAGLGECEPINAATVAAYCTAIATHYDGVVSEYEFYNEVNDVTNWNPEPNVADYSQFLTACYNAIKAVDPTITVVSSGTDNNNNPPDHIGPVAWVDGLYANGAKFDVLGFHPYTYPYSPSYDLSTEHASGWYAMTQIRAIMVSNGDSAKQIWATEYGASTCGPGNAYNLNQDAGFTFGSDYMTLAAQQQMAADAIATMKTESWLGKLFWYTYTGSNSDNNSTPEDCFGVTYTSGKPKPVWATLRSTT